MNCTFRNNSNKTIRIGDRKIKPNEVFEADDCEEHVLELADKDWIVLHSEKDPEIDPELEPVLLTEEVEDF